ncbi:MAG: hypothetical protein J5748_00495 [Bacteroidales bacterium]|nr:hypothetical protein [Bacteroidales bacterium]
MVFAFGALSKAESPRLRYGLQWGYNAKVATGYEYTIYNSFGSRISDSQPLTADYYTNAFVSADLGLEFLNYFAFTLKAGYRGVAKDYRIMPAELQFSIFPWGYDQHGLFFLGGGGFALYHWSLEDKINLLSAGMGLRRNMGMKVSLDGFLKANLTTCSPLPVDPVDGQIPRDRTVYSRAKYISIDLGLALYF